MFVSKSNQFFDYNGRMASQQSYSPSLNGNLLANNLQNINNNCNCNCNCYINCDHNCSSKINDNCNCALREKSQYMSENVDDHNNIRKPRKKLMFTKQEDILLRKVVGEYGEKDWNFIASFIEGRNRRQCRERWMKFLSPELNNSPWTKEEDDMIMKCYEKYGPKWATIAKSFKARSDISVKSRYLVIMRRTKKMKDEQKIAAFASPAIIMDRIAPLLHSKSINSKICSLTNNNSNSFNSADFKSNFDAIFNASFAVKNECCIASSINENGNDKLSYPNIKEEEEEVKINDCGNEIDECTVESMTEEEESSDTIKSNNDNNNQNENDDNFIRMDEPSVVDMMLAPLKALERQMQVDIWKDFSSSGGCNGLYFGLDEFV